MADDANKINAMSHGKLVAHAKEWLLSAKGCNPVFVERGSAKSSEMPDAIGWNSQSSILVECKASVSDFRADKMKPFRIDSDKGMGRQRFFLFGRSVYLSISKDEIPDGWGVVVVDEMSGRIAQERRMFSKEWQYDMKAELYYLRSRILQIQKYGR